MCDKGLKEEQFLTNLLIKKVFVEQRHLAFKTFGFSLKKYCLAMFRKLLFPISMFANLFDALHVFIVV